MDQEASVSSPREYSARNEKGVPDQFPGPILGLKVPGQVLPYRCLGSHLHHTKWRFNQEVDSRIAHPIYDFKELPDFVHAPVHVPGGAGTALS